MTGYVGVGDFYTPMLRLIQTSVETKRRAPISSQNDAKNSQQTKCEHSTLTLNSDNRSHNPSFKQSMAVEDRSHQLEHENMNDVINSRAVARFQSAQEVKDLSPRISCDNVDRCVLLRPPRQGDDVTTNEKRLSKEERLLNELNGDVIDVLVPSQTPVSNDVIKRQ